MSKDTINESKSQQYSKDMRGGRRWRRLLLIGLSEDAYGQSEQVLDLRSLSQMLML